MSDKNIALSVNELYKSFRLPHEQHNRLKDKLLNLRSKTTRGYEKQHVLKGVDFDVKKGEFFGIVGRNGSGKSTLLKILAGVYVPDKGGVKINGTLTPFIELGVGFNPDLSGRENVFLNGALLGFGRKEMEVMYDDIVAFAELERFMDQKLKNYSSGMQVRLAFSIAIQAKSDILLLDEVLAVGDAAFQRKCFEYFAQLKRNKKTVILVSHSMESVQQFCTRALLLNDGEIMMIGNPKKIAKAYGRLNRPDNTNYDSIEDDDTSVEDNDILDKYNVKIQGSNKKNTKTITGDDKWVHIEASLDIKEDIKDAFFALTIRKQSGELAYWYSTEDSLPQITFHKSSGINATFKLQNIFGEGVYEIGLYVKSKDRIKEYIEIDNAHSFIVVDRGPNGYMLFPEAIINVR